MNPADLHALRTLATNIFDADDHGAVLVPKVKLLEVLDQVAALNDLLVRYGNHLPFCHYSPGYPDCLCGWIDAEVK